MAKKIIIVEDARDVQLILRTCLEDHYTLTFAETIARASELSQQNTYDLAILDVMLPDGTGFEFCLELRSRENNKNTPVIFLTGQSDVPDRVRGLELGAEDYILKPCAPDELLARVRRRLQPRGQSTSLESAGLKIDIATQSVTLTEEGQPERELELTRLEFKLLLHFLRNPGKIFSRSELLKEVWGHATHVSEHTVDTHISSLRKKIAGSRCTLKSVVKQGYCAQLNEP